MGIKRADYITRCKDAYECLTAERRKGLRDSALDDRMCLLLRLQSGSTKIRRTWYFDEKMKKRYYDTEIWANNGEPVKKWFGGLKYPKGWDDDGVCD